MMACSHGGLSGFSLPCVIPPMLLSQFHDGLRKLVRAAQERADEKLIDNPYMAMQAMKPLLATLMPKQPLVQAGIDV